MFPPKPGAAPPAAAAPKTGSDNSRLSRSPSKRSSIGVGVRSHIRSRSIQFKVSASDTDLPSRPASSTANSIVSADGRDNPHRPARIASPPPPSTYERGVSFDTFDNRNAADFSLTLNYKHKGYQSTRRSRTFLVGTDANEYSDFALEWLMDDLVCDGDEVVCLRVVDKDSRIASDANIEGKKYRQEAQKLFEQVIRKNRQDEKAISLVLELAVGKVQEIIQRMIQIYEPSILVVGTRGRNLNGMQGLLPGSVSKYCLQHSPIPVTVVRPSLKREKKKQKRLADPTRRSYNQILEMSERRGSRFFDASSGTDSSLTILPDEEAAVAEALGLSPSYFRSRSSVSVASVSEKSSSPHDEHEPTSSVMWDSLDEAVKQAHTSGDFDSPELTDSESAGTPLGSLGHDLSPVKTNDSTASNSSTLRPDTSSVQHAELAVEELSPVSGT